MEPREQRVEAAGLEGVCLEAEAQQKTLLWNQGSTLPTVMDSKACQSFHEALEAWAKGPGTEPFYVHANLTLLERADTHALCVKAKEILQLLDPAYKRRQEWFCTRVDPITLTEAPRSDLKKRALDQLWLVRPKPVGEAAGDAPEQLLLEPCGEAEHSLRPYSLVRPLLVSALRPVVLLPECLAPWLIRNLLDLPSSRLDF
ncbi:Caspase recruitment domain-containing protein 10 [Saguinus oedipus]|uniref:Caspase recruitment domain-containing protein 10 n=1 Tax=Saguinus oedipus TaxID=9490 RepID=A0ABQ9VVC5_SAGOE|nr:Caspase recruitment domain-containing protein 10 [Saguinus oedipus]